MPSTNLYVIATIATSAALLVGASYVMGMFKKKRKICEFGISILYNPPRTKKTRIDIVFVHSLGVDSSSAWSDNDFSWPEHELPKKLEESGFFATIAAYDYDSNYRTPEYLTRRTLFRQAEGLIEALAEYKRPNLQRHTLFICHSLGGLLVKNALVNGRASHKEEVRNASNTVSGIVFLDTPHCSSPSALAERLCNILEVDKDSDEGQDLRDRSTTLACNLERFKPLSDSLLIRDFVLKPKQHGKHKPTNEIGNTGAPKSPLHKQHLLDGESSKRCNFSTPTNRNLQEIIKTIRNLCFRATKVPLQQEPTMLTVFGYDQVGDLGLDKTLSGRCSSIIQKPLPEFYQVRSFFGLGAASTKQAAITTNPSKRHSNIWSIAILEGHQGCGKTQLSLQYVHRHQKDYSSILWLNATNEKSLELSFQSVARRMILHSAADPATAAQRLGLEGIDLDSKKDLQDDEFYTIFSVVTEWLASPHTKKWLLVLDGLSLESGFPDANIWTGRLGQKGKKPKSWASILPLLPSTANERGDIIISTRDRAAGVGCEIIRFSDEESSKLDFQNIPGYIKTREQNTYQRIRQWWENADGWKRNVLETIQILSDKKCCDIPVPLLQSLLPKDQSLDKLEVPGLYKHGTSLRSSELLLELGTNIFREFSTDSIGQNDIESIDQVDTDSLSQSLRKAAVRSWKILAKSMESTQSRHDLIFTWDFEAQTVQNVQAALRRCDRFLSDRDMTEVFSSTKDRRWAKLGTICENHAQFETAARLYQLERNRHRQGTELYFSLELDCARVYQRCQKESDAETAYGNMFSEKYKSISFGQRETACRQFASFRASQSRFNDAIDKLIGLLALESPFGEAVDKPTITDSVLELAGYLRKAGNKSAASALLQRKLASLEGRQGLNHPKTLAVMEALSVTKLEEGELQEARGLLTHVLDLQKQRLGEEHPVTVRCASKVAATWDLEGETQVAKKKYLECIDAGIASLGSHHPVVSGIRDDFVRFLLTQGNTEEARKELDKLMAEAKNFAGLYPKGFAERIRRLQNPNLDLDDLDPNKLFRRSTLGAGGLCVESFGEDDY